MSSIGVIGAGAFGTALACALANAGHSITLWGRNADQMAAMAATRTNKPYLADVKLPDTLTPTARLEDLSNSESILVVVPAQQLRGLLANPAFSKLKAPLVLCAKGIELKTGALQSDIVHEVLPSHSVATISGPGFANEIAAGKPTALTIASDDAALGKALQQSLSTPTLRLYLSNDIQGVQLGGALKNVFAIACGLVEGAGLGRSAQAALMTRSFAEMKRLAVAMGAQESTLSGLSGFGDLVLSCSSPMSRNFSFGYTLGEQGSFSTGKTYEGVATAQACLALAEKYDVDMPIAQAIAEILQGDMDVGQALKILMSRPLRSED